MTEVKVEIIIREKANGVGFEAIKRAGAHEVVVITEGPTVESVLQQIQVTA